MIVSSEYPSLQAPLKNAEQFLPNPSEHPKDRPLPGIAAVVPDRGEIPYPRETINSDCSNPFFSEGLYEDSSRAGRTRTCRGIPLILRTPPKVR